MLETAMKKKHLTAPELATRTGFSRQYVHDVLTGHRRISVAFAVKVAPILGVSPRVLLIEQLDADLARAS